ncbi:MAG: hypothetical protein GXO43_04660 [Crenarchaeota archaeon]|nr:hypothetical protein [Thermoproteota archaeon]
MGVKYILLTKEVDYKKYSFLFNQSDLRLVLETSNFYVFKNLDFHGLAYLDNGSEVFTRVVNPAKVLVKSPPGQLIFTWQYSPYWHLDGEKPSRFFAACSFRLDRHYEGYAVYSRYYVVFTSYAISLISLLTLVTYYAYRKLKLSS